MRGSAAGIFFAARRPVREVFCDAQTLAGGFGVKGDKAFFGWQDTADAQSELVADFDDFTFSNLLIAYFDNQRAFAALVKLDHHTRR